ncbi:uncharacterized protein LOC135499939 [Lineus longissimus]|uniref:uncharacterized protein LOC135499939 n=1 Tax=Lineus longissimus TaxID=88925 RepID=UPI00315DC644
MQQPVVEVQSSLTSYPVHDDLPLHVSEICQLLDVQPVEQLFTGDVANFAIEPPNVVAVSDDQLVTSPKADTVQQQKMYTECFDFLDSMETSVADMHTKHFLTTLLAGFDTGKLKHLCDQIEQYNMCIAKQYHVKDGCYDKCMLEFIRTNLESRGITTAVARYGFSVLLLNAYNRVADSSNPEDLITLDKLTEESIQHFEAHPYDKYTDDMTDKMRTDDSTCVKMHDEKLFWDDLRPIVERGHWYTTKTLEVQLMNVVKKHEVDHLVEVLDTTLFRYWKGKVEKDQKEKCKTPISQNESKKALVALSFVPYNTDNVL